MGLFDWIILVFVLTMAYFIFDAVIKSKKRGKLVSSLESIRGFTISQKLISRDGITGIALDEKRQKICLIRLVTKGGKEYPSSKVCSYKDILQSDIVENGNTVTSTSRTSQGGRLLLGGLLLGPVGAVVGGLSGKTKSKEKINSIILSLTVNNPKNPIHNITLLDTECSKEQVLYINAIQEARHWHGLVKVLIKKADKVDKANEVDKNKESDLTTPVEKTELVKPTSIADELTKLAQLKEQGILSEDEFLAQKSKLLTS